MRPSPDYAALYRFAGDNPRGSLSLSVEDSTLDPIAVLRGDVPEPLALKRVEGKKVHDVVSVSSDTLLLSAKATSVLEAIGATAGAWWRSAPTP